MGEGFERYHPDVEALHHGFRTEPAFVCSMVQGEIRFPENIIYEDDRALVFLDAYPRASGYTLVAPKEHREQVTAETSRWRSTSTSTGSSTGFPRRYARRSGPSGCTYTFGSKEGNSHAHWHVVPLPPGVPYEEQQGKWASWTKGVLKIPPEEMAALAERIGRRIERIYPD